MNALIYKPLPYQQTAKSARNYFFQHGIKITQWARTWGLDEEAVKDVLYRRSPGRSGKAHAAAVARGLKKAPKK